MVEILFVHGALVRDGNWWWRQVAQRIHEQTGSASRSVELPSCGEGASPGTAGWLEDTQALRDALDNVDEAVIVGHSYGGTVIAEGADHPATHHLVYITSYLPDVGQSQADIMSGEQDPVKIAPGDDGTVRLAGYTVSSFGDRFLQDVTDEEIRAEAWNRVTPQSVGAFGTPTTQAAWRGRPSTYLVCTEDRSTSLALQRFHASRATRSIDLATGHHPFLSRPDLVSEELIRVLRTD
ncbi:alpha/beta hydrolase [Oculatella sp. FACHB-28]|uniref:alpha/beta hydrolase n=1 Tax=Oculatella sp. FACHB-28 TaxID=2692845 RepID=UPI0018EF5163|nr:alpha/beta hydrolase [Oculatella sp. FACHB-28]